MSKYTVSRIEEVIQSPAVHKFMQKACSQSFVIWQIYNLFGRKKKEKKKTIGRMYKTIGRMYIASLDLSLSGSGNRICVQDLTFSDGRSLWFFSLVIEEAKWLHKNLQIAQKQNQR